MLVLTRRLNEEIVFPASHTLVRVLDVRGGTVRLGVEAPREVPVVRGELLGHQPGAAAPRSVITDRNQSAPGGEATKVLLARLKATDIGLGLVALQLDAGHMRGARETLAALRDDFQLLRLGAEGEWQIEPVPAEPAPLKSPRRALLVEDDRNQRELLAGFLRLSGLEVETAGDGCDALDYLRSGHRPDMVLLDMGMPRCDGPSTVRQIRSDPAMAGLKVFAVTGHRPEDFDLECGARGIDRWFQKPLDPEGLVRELTTELGRVPCHV